MDKEELSSEYRSNMNNFKKPYFAYLNDNCDDFNGPAGSDCGGAPGPMRGGRNGGGWNDNMDWRGARYGEAFGDYQGGYGSGGGFGPGGDFDDGANFGQGGNFGDGGGFGSGRSGPNCNFGSGPAPPFMGRGYGPNGPNGPNNQQHPAIKYLIRCGIAKEYVYNLPRDLLDLMEPQRCGVCHQNLESFALSRIHYSSKKHYKKQKKFIYGPPEMLPSRREFQHLPLKSRELYCELCDVQITSKVHADSHYAGKSHRAIVEGRRKVKNLRLLEPGMDRRVSQLIRREKKQLKVPVEAVEVESEEAAPAKPVVPELYCNICRTSVTCSDQMTMHLNGKRHLAKEKQHILRQMKCDTAGNDDEYYDESGAMDEQEVENEGENGEAAAGNGEEGADADAGTVDEGETWEQGGGEAWEKQG